MKLAAYAAFRSRNLLWRTGSDVTLAKGLMPDDIAAQAIVSVIGGERKWEPERGPLLPFLKRVVDSLLNHLALSADNRRIERFSQVDTSPYGAERIAFQDGDEGQWPRRPADFDAADPSESESDADERIDRLVEAAKGTPELAEVLNAILEFSEARPRLIAIRIGKPVNHVNNCLKRLRRLALKISADAEGLAASRGAIHP
jgi:DNA-directed RNA polymerase specialized sigma24 family protein